MFERRKASTELTHQVLDYWLYESLDKSIQRQKIVPDGYFEIIIHWGDPYRLNLHGTWETQSKYLFAGQIDTHFFLENTGVSRMIGIKLKPVAAYQLFGISMDKFVNKVVDIQELDPSFSSIENKFNKNSLSLKDRISLIENWLLDMLSRQKKMYSERVENAINRIFDMNGMVDMDFLASQTFISNRQLQRDFKKYIGLSPKKYARIIRFNYIFELIKESDFEWVDLANQTGYFDQAHFIKNFKEFTGEEPTSYGFDEINMANFFLKKQ